MFSFFKRAQDKLDLNSACFTTKNVVNRKLPITKVYHFSDDNWQFSDSESTNSNKNIMIVSLGQILKIDKTVEKVLKMSKGYRAERTENNTVWKISKFKEAD
jgi:hypothetical protein